MSVIGLFACVLKEPATDALKTMLEGMFLQVKRCMGKVKNAMKLQRCLVEYA
jgi:hypothetical protein